MNDRGDCKTAPATLGLLKLDTVVELVGGGSVINGGPLRLVFELLVNYKDILFILNIFC